MAPLIDFHTHFFPNKLFDAIWKWFESYAWPIEYKHYADELIGILKKNGVTRAVSLHYPHKPQMAEALNEWAYTLGQKYPDFIIPFGSVHPDDEAPPKILKTCFETYGFKGIKLHSHVQKMSPDDPRLVPIYETLNDYRKILLFHCGTGPHFKEKQVNGYGYDVTSVSGVKLFEKIIGTYPHITFVIPHLGFEEIPEFMTLLDYYPNLYFDTAMALGSFFKIPPPVDWFHKYPDRFLFGTDFPNIPYPWETEKEALKVLNLDCENQIFYQNAQKILGL